MIFPPRSQGPVPAQSDELTYEPYFGLREKPFSLNSELRFLYDSPSHAASLRHLLDGTRRREGLLVLTGEIGTGKTTLCRAVLERLGKMTFSSFVPDPFISHEDLLKRLLIDFGVISIGELTSGSLKGTSRTELSYLLSGFLETLVPLDAYVVVIIDEAQNLSGPMIDATRILSDSFDAPGRLQIVLVGQLELLEKLKSPEMRQVDQRITSYTRLEPLSRDGVAGYIEHRLLVAGGCAGRVLFTPDAVQIIHRRTGGVPRLVNRVCDRALHVAHERQAAMVDPGCLDAALASIGATTFTPTWASIVFAETPDGGHPAAAPAPASVMSSVPSPAREPLGVPTQVVRVPVPMTQAAAPVDSRRIALSPPNGDEWLTETPRPLVTDENFLTSIDELMSTAQEEDVREEPPPEEPPVGVAVSIPVPARRLPPLTPLAPPAFAAPERVWPKRLGIAAMFAALIAIAVGVYQWPTLSSGFTQAQPPADIVAAPVVQPAAEETASQPVTPPVSEPSAAAASTAEYFVTVGLYVSRTYADVVASTLVTAGLPATRRAIELRGGAYQQVVLGPFQTRDEATTGLQQLRQLGGHDDAQVVEVPPTP